MKKDDYSPEQASAILKYVQHGVAIGAISQAEGMPPVKTMLRWRRNHPHFASAWDNAEVQAQLETVRLGESERQIICKDVFYQYATSTTPMKQILESNEGYPRYDTLYKWRTTSSAIEKMWRQAEYIKAIVLAEDAMVKADALDADDPRAVVLQVRCRHWLAERYNPAKFGSGGEERKHDDLEGRTQEELDTILASLVKEAESIGMTIPKGNVH